MKAAPRAIELDLSIERDGFRVRLRGAGEVYTAEFLSLRSLFHFAKLFWRLRPRLPRRLRLYIQWRALRLRAPL